MVYAWFTIIFLFGGALMMFLGKLTSKTKLVGNSIWGFLDNGKIFIKNKEKAEFVTILALIAAWIMFAISATVAVFGVTDFVYSTSVAAADLISGKTAERQAAAKEREERRAKLRARNDQNAANMGANFGVAPRVNFNPRTDDPVEFSQRRRDQLLTKQQEILGDLKRQQSEILDKMDRMSNPKGIPDENNPARPAEEVEPEFPPAQKRFPMRTWVSADGKKARLALVGTEDGKIVVVDKDGVQYKLPLDAFSDEDQAYVLDSMN